MIFFEKVKGFLLEPANTFDVLKDSTLVGTIKYYFILVLIYSTLYTLMPLLFGVLPGSTVGEFGMISVARTGIEEAIGTFTGEFISGFSMIFIGGAFLHSGVYIAGGKKGIDQTLKTLMYGSTPSLLLGWMPFIDIIAGIWSFILYIIGLQYLQGLTKRRSSAAVLIPLIILSLLTAALVGDIFLFGLKIPIRDLLLEISWI